MAPKTYTISFLGDIMLGRLIDQLLPTHVDESDEASHVSAIRKRQPELKDYNSSSPWGNTLSLLNESDLVLGNLETSATTSEEKWPDKVFNYRMHPANIECLKVRKLDYVSLANNHTLDFGRSGLFETVEVLERAGIAYAGAGRTVSEAQRPAVLHIPSSRSQSSGQDPQRHEIHLYSFSDHPSDWEQVPEFNLIRYTEAHQTKMKDILTCKHPDLSSKPALKIVSIHWGPNYAWEPDHDITNLARFLIDECAVDIIHGHSSHHVQGVESYEGTLIIYGCGDFVDDYAVVPSHRNDLSAVWNVIVAEKSNGDGLELLRLEVFPNRIKSFQAGLIPSDDLDHKFVRDRVTELSAKLGTAVERELGNEGQLVVHLNIDHNET